MNTQMHSKRVLFALLVLVLALQGTLAQEKSVELDSVLERAAQYVALYEDRLGDVSGEESYRQVSVSWSDIQLRMNKNAGWNPIS
jgi:hypothetical protein